MLAPQDAEYENLRAHPNIELLSVADRFHRNWLEKLRQVHFRFPALCNQLQIDKVVSLGNVAFPAGGRPQLVYIQLAQLGHPDSPAWQRMSPRARQKNRLMDRYVAYHLKYATAIAVQTEVMRRRLAARFHRDESSLLVLPNAALLPQDVTPMPEPRLPLRLLFLSHYYEHKNFECLPALAASLQRRQVPVEISLTLDMHEAAGAAKVLQALQPFSFVRNLGPLRLEEVGPTLDAHHGVFLPSLLESYSGVFAEALRHRRYIFTGRLDFATELLGDAAFYFDPLDAENIAQVLQDAIQNPERGHRVLQAADSLASTLPDTVQVCQLFSQMIDRI